ncbi:MAG: hypothetical protein WBY73_09780, partial [Candidatus Acidiferrales bacterium]
MPEGPGFDDSRAQKVRTQSQCQKNDRGANVLALFRSTGDINPSDERNNRRDRVKPHAVGTLDLPAIFADGEDRDDLRDELEDD